MDSRTKISGIEKMPPQKKVIRRLFMGHLSFFFGYSEYFLLLCAAK